MPLRARLLLRHPSRTPPASAVPLRVLQQTGKFVPEKSNIWRDACDGMYDWVREHIMEGCTLNESDHCGDPPLILAAGGGAAACTDVWAVVHAQICAAGCSQTERAAAHGCHACVAGHLACTKLLLDEGAGIEQRNVVRALQHACVQCLTHNLCC